MSQDASLLKMKVNANRLSVMTVNFIKPSPSFTNPIPPKISITCIKLLGVTITADLKWDAHVQNILKQASPSFPFLKINKLASQGSLTYSQYIQAVEICQQQGRLNFLKIDHAGGRSVSHRDSYRSRWQRFFPSFLHLLLPTPLNHS